MMKRWMAVLGMVFLWSPVVWAEDPVYFADDNLKAAVEARLKKTNPTPTDMLDLAFLDAGWLDITDLTGLEYATNLMTLELRGNQISDISPLGGLTNLTGLFLSSNQVSDLSPLARLTNLTHLGLAGNQISDISPLARLTNLRQLFLQDNPLNPAACSVYIPRIIENNPGIQIYYDPCIGAAVPNVVGMTQAEAEAALIAAGFVVGTIWWGPSDLPEGMVYAQNPAGGETVSPGSAVDLICSQAGGGPTVPGADCLIAHWKLDETGGEVAFDSVGQNDGVTYGQPLWQPAGGRIAGALQFDGVDDYAELPIGPVIGSLTDSTFATWVNWTGGSDGQRIFDFGGGPINMFLTPCADGIGRMRFAVTQAGARSQNQATAPQALAAGWHHVAVTIDAAGQTYLLYLDGEVVGTKTEAQCTPSSLGDTSRNWLGRSQEPTVPYFHGLLDDFRIYGCALSAAEVTQLAAEVPPDPNLLAWWKLDETWGSTVFDSAGQSDGVTYGGPLWQPTGGQIGGALQFDGVNDYAQLPIGSLIHSLTDSTFATWVNWSGSGGDWQRVFDFGSTASVNMFFTPCNSQTGSMRFAITNAGESAQDRVTTAQALGTGWHHVAVTIDAARQTYLLYVDGRVVGGKTAGQYTPSSLGETTCNWLGRSQWPADPYFNGALDDFRIYGRVLSGAEIAQMTPGAAGYPILRLDFSNNNVATQTEAGFTSFTLADSGSMIDGITVELAGSLEARWRGAPTGIPYELIYRDFIFARPGGMTVTLSGLEANAAYEITIYAYDTGSTAGGDRIADWTANGEFCLTAGFTASVTPVAAEDYAFTGMAQANGTGKIVLEAGPNVDTTEQSGATNPFAFLNALVISSAEP